MQEQTFSERFEQVSGEALEQVKKLLHEGNVRRISVKQNDRTIAEFPLIVGVVGAVFAPVVAALGALTALVTDCAIEVERVDRQLPAELPTDAAAPTASL